MAALISALHALPAVTRAPLDLLGFAALAAAAFVGLLAVERRVRDPLIDLNPVRRRRLRARHRGGLDCDVVHPGTAVVLQSGRAEPDGPGTDAGRRRPVAIADELRAADLRVLRTVAHAPLRPAARPCQRHAVDRRGQRGDCHRGGRADVGTARCRIVRHRCGSGIAVRCGAASRPRDPAARPSRRGVRHHQCLHVSRRKHRRGSRGGCLRAWRAVGGAGAHRGLRPHRGMALPATAGIDVSRRPAANQMELQCSICRARGNPLPPAEWTRSSSTL